MQSITTPLNPNPACHVIQSCVFHRDKPFDVVVGTGTSHGMEMDDTFNPLFVAVPDKVRFVLVVKGIEEL